MWIVLGGHAKPRLKLCLVSLKGNLLAAVVHL